MNGASGVCVSTIVTSLVAPVATPSSSSGLRTDDVQPGQPFVQLKGGRHRPRDETEVPADPLGQRLRRQLQRQRVGHPFVDHGSEGA